MLTFFAVGFLLVALAGGLTLLALWLFPAKPTADYTGKPPTKERLEQARRVYATSGRVPPPLPSVRPQPSPSKSDDSTLTNILLWQALSQPSHDPAPDHSHNHTSSFDHTPSVDHSPSVDHGSSFDSGGSDFGSSGGDF